MIIDAKVDYKSKKLILIKADGTFDEKELIPPYFYVIVSPKQEKILRRVVGTDETWIERDNRKAIVYKETGYEADPLYIIYRIYTQSPSLVPQISEKLQSLGFRIAGSNVRYIIRNCFDHDIRFFNTIPLYYGFDSDIMNKIRNVEGLIIDVEAIEGEPILASVYRYRPFEEIRKDDVEAIELPKDIDRLRTYIHKYSMIMGHNIIGFDIPVLSRAGLMIDTLTKTFFDSSVVLSTYGHSLKVGSARSLLDVSIVLKDEAGVTDEEIEIKKKVRGRIDRLSKEDLVKYNTNDVVLTAKLLNIFFPFVASVSALTQIPLSEVMTLPSGMVAEYYLLRFIELLGYVPEYRPTKAILQGERVWVASEGVEYRNVLQTDVKMMYPSFVLNHFIDPTLYIGDDKFDRRRGIGVVYSAVKRLRTIRDMTKKLKKQNKIYDPVDHGVKSILNALAYGVQGKKSGLAILGNPWCPTKIFYGTRDAQFETIKYMLNKGYKVIYSDTDSFYIALNNCRDDEDCENTAVKIVNELNDFLKKYGLEVDVEGIWERMYVYSKKNYILKKGDVVIVKGSALINLDRFYTVEALSVQELLKYDDKAEREKILREIIETAPLEDLFVRGHQQIWRLIGKDVQSWKRLRDRRVRYMRVLTPWNEKPTLVLKKARGAQLLLPHSSPILTLFLEHGNEVDLSTLNPFNIVELRSLRVDGEVGRLKGRYRLGDIIVYTDSLYTIKVDSIKYGIRAGQNVRLVDMWYNGTFPDRPVGVLEFIRGSLKMWRVKVDEDLFRKLVYLEMKKVLKQYGFL